MSLDRGADRVRRRGLEHQSVGRLYTKFGVANWYRALTPIKCQKTDPTEKHISA
jgi:hypothetical protein